MTSTIVDDIRARLREVAVPERSARLQAYMRSEMPFLGVSVPDARRVAVTAARALTDATALRSAARELWDQASHREDRYAAMAILSTRIVRADPANVPLVEHMVRTGRWWDYTDELTHRVAELLDVRPDETSTLARDWARDNDMWMRRLGILSQLGRRDRVDPELLADTILPNAADPEFFIRKAIGWALREYARVAPDWVRAFVAAHALNPLSRREALKRLGGPE